jgi:hypothetical protein
MEIQVEICVSVLVVVGNQTGACLVCLTRSHSDVYGWSCDSFFPFFVPNSGFLICSTYFDKRSMIYLSTSLLMSRLRVCLSFALIVHRFSLYKLTHISHTNGLFQPTGDFCNLDIKLPTLDSLSYSFLSNGFFSTIFFVSCF